MFHDSLKIESVYSLFKIYSHFFNATKREKLKSNQMHRTLSLPRGHRSEEVEMLRLAPAFIKAALIQSARRVQHNRTPSLSSIFISFRTAPANLSQDFCRTFKLNNKKANTLIINYLNNQ